MLRRRCLSRWALTLLCATACGDETPDFGDAGPVDGGGVPDGCTELAPCTLGEGTVASEFLGAVGDVDPWTFEVSEAGRIIDLAVYNDARFSPVQLELRLFGPGEVSLENARSEGAGAQRVRIQRVAETAGAYRLEVRDVGDDARDDNNPYFIELRLIAPADESEPNDDRDTATPLGLGEPASGGIETQGDEDWFAVELQAGRRVQVAVAAPAGGEVRHRWVLFGPDGVPIAEGTEGGEGWGDDVRPVLMSGTHHVVIQDDDGAQAETGRRYTVRVDELDEPDVNESGIRNDTPSAATAVAPGTPVSGYVASTADIDWFAIDVPAASESAPALLTAQVSMPAASEVDLRMVVYEPDGETWVCERRDGDRCRAVRLIRDGRGSLGPTALATAHPVTAPGRYLVSVQDLQDDEHDADTAYQLVLDLPAEPDPGERYAGDGRGAARWVGAATSTTGASIQFPWVEGYLSYAGDTDWYAFDLPGREAAELGMNVPPQTGDWLVRIELEMPSPTPVELNAFFYGPDGSDRERYRGVGRRCRDPDDEVPPGIDPRALCQWPDERNGVRVDFQTSFRSTPDGDPGDDCFVVFREVTAEGPHYWRVSDLDRDDFDLSSNGRYRLRMTVTAGCPTDSACMGRFLRNGQDLCGRN